MAVIKQSVARNRSFLMVQSADHISPLTGATVTVTISKNGAAFAAPGGGVTEIGNGWYNIAFTGTDTNTLGDLDVHATAAAADPTDFQDEVSAIDFSDPVRMGLTALPNATAGANGGLATVGVQIPNAAAGASAGLLINGTNTGATFTSGLTTNIAGNVSGSVGTVAGSISGDVQGKVLGGGSSTIAGDGAQATLRQGQADLVWQSNRFTQETGTAQSGGANSITLRSGAPAVDGWFIGCLIQIISGTGAGQSRVIIAYTGSAKVATLDQNWVVNPDNTSVYAIAMDDLPACNSQQAVVASAVVGGIGGSITGNVLGNVNGRVLGGGPSAIVGVGVWSNVQSWNGVAVVAPNTPGVPKVDVAEWVGGVPNNLISGLVPVNTQNTAATLSYNLSGNITGTVGSVTGSVGSVTNGVTVTTNNDKQGYALSGAEHTNITADVWDVNAANHVIPGSFGSTLNTAIAQGQNPWAALLPGTNLPGTAGYILGHFVDAQVSTRQPAGPVTVGGYSAGQDPASIVLAASDTPFTTVGTIGYDIVHAAIGGDPWSRPLPGSYQAGTAGNIIGNNLNAAITSRMATFSLPTNFSNFAVDGQGRIVVQPNGLDSIQIEAGLNCRQAISVCSAAMAGVLSGATGTNISIQAANNPNQNRIAAVVDANGDRTSVNLTLP